VKGEVALVLAPASGRPEHDDRALDALRRLVDAGARPRKAAAVVADLTGGTANELYRELTAGSRPDRGGGAASRPDRGGGGASRPDRDGP
jgi:hypothetical protein